MGITQRQGVYYFGALRTHAPRTAMEKKPVDHPIDRDGVAMTPGLLIVLSILALLVYSAGFIHGEHSVRRIRRRPLI